jgi:hypothetical protein
VLSDLVDLSGLMDRVCEQRGQCLERITRIRRQAREPMNLNPLSPPQLL